MLLSKWVLAEKENYIGFSQLADKPGLCLQYNDGRPDMPELYRFTQGLSFGQLTLFLSDESFKSIGNNKAAAIEDIITLFFQPSFYIQDNCPVIFAQCTAVCASDILNQVREKCKRQGFSDIMVLQPGNNKDILPRYKASLFYVEEKPLNLDTIIDNWIRNYFTTGEAGAIHLLIKETSSGSTLKSFGDIIKHEQSSAETERYIFANRLYFLEREIDALNKKILIQKVNEYNLEQYLAIQKMDLAKALDWYHNEYDITPLWYKQLGHLIKVITGKRSFRSLFSDKVKKYKD